MTDLPSYTGPRVKLVLGEFPILRVVDNGFGIKQFSIQIQGVRLVLDAPHEVDVREGDLLSLYTEVALALPSQPQKQ